MSVKTRVGFGGTESSSKNYLPRKFVILLCIGSFCAGMFFTERMWMEPEGKDAVSTRRSRGESMSMTQDQKQVIRHEHHHVPRGISMKDNSVQSLEKTISKLEVELAAARAAQESIMNGSPLAESLKIVESTAKRKYLMVIGINTAFNSRKRRDSVRGTWMPQGEKRKKLEEEKGIVIRFVIGHSSTSGGILDKAIEAEEKKHGDFLRLEHVEGYLELSAKTKAYFATAVGLWDADFYIKVDDDVHVNLATLGKTLSRHRLKPRVYVGCMKSGPILAKKWYWSGNGIFEGKDMFGIKFHYHEHGRENYLTKIGVRYEEPEHWKFGGEGNKYFRHATGQLYAISNDLATYIAINQHVLHKYANEDVSLGSWLIGLDVTHVDDKGLCCGTPPDCEWKAQAGNVCGATFDWTCSGICKSDERIFEVHQRCGESEDEIWKPTF